MSTATTDPSNPGSPHYAENLVHDIAMEAIHEKRKARRWRNFWFFLLAVYFTPSFIYSVTWYTGSLSFGGSSESGHAAKVVLTGAIAANSAASAANINKALTEAFEDEEAAGVVLEVNSSGGSPVQSSYIYDHIKQLRAEHPEKPLYAVITDIGASGAYFAAAAADEIYASRSSIVGSIGVRMDSFGAVDFMESLGIERRLFVAGENKGMLDPFLPTTSKQVAAVTTMLEKVHGHFIDSVKAGRGDRLSNSPELFSGLVWSGEQAIELGLVDGLGSVEWVKEEKLGATEFKVYGSSRSALRQLIGVAGNELLESLYSSVNEVVFR